MQLILVGCEFAGKRTLGRKIWEWWGEQAGVTVLPEPHTAFHDHFVVPHVVHPAGHESHKEQSEKDILNINPGLLEHYQRYQIDYHFLPSFLNEPDHWLIDWYYGDAVYAPLYYGYGRRGEYGDRRLMVRSWDLEVVERMPNAVLVLISAAPDTIRARMRAHPKSPKSLLQEQDVEHVLGRFQEEFDQSLITQRFVIDTTGKTADEELREFTAQVEPYITPRDRVRIINHQATKA